MVTGNMPFKQAAGELKIDWTAAECDKITRRTEFKRILREERNRIHTDVANTPGRNKSSAIGMMVLALENLMAEGEYDKVIAGIEKLAKLEGWMGGDSNIQIFAGLTAKDLAEAKGRLQKELDGKAESNTESRYTN